jgi:hypothetical protein
MLIILVLLLYYFIWYYNDLYIYINKVSKAYLIYKVRSKVIIINTRYNMYYTFEGNNDTCKQAWALNIILKMGSLFK